MRAMTVVSVTALVVLVAATASAQRPASPRGEASTQVGGTWTTEESQGTAGGRRYEGGKWIDIESGRPILTGRDNIFGSGADYGQAFLLGAPIWRVGANQSTTLTTEVDLMFGGQRLAAGTYTMFAELSASEWTLIFSTFGVKQSFREETPNAL